MKKPSTTPGVAKPEASLDISLDALGPVVVRVRHKGEVRTITAQEVWDALK